MTTSIVLYGGIKLNDSLSWLEFYEYACSLIEEVKVEPNFIGVTGQSFKTGKVSPLKRAQQKLIKSINDEEEIVSLAIYSLPKDYKIAAFDYNVYICRTSQLKEPHIIVTFSDNLYQLIDQSTVIKKLKELIIFQSGQVFELSKMESPQIYASKANSLNAFKTLKILEEF